MFCTMPNPEWVMFKDDHYFIVALIYTSSYSLFMSLPTADK